MTFMPVLEKIRPRLGYIKQIFIILQGSVFYCSIVSGRIGLVLKIKIIIYIYI